MQASDSQSWKARGKLSPRDSIPYQTVSRLPVANQVFLGFWMVDIHQEGHRKRSAPQKRHTEHLRRHAHCTPRKPSSWDRGGDKIPNPPRDPWDFPGKATGVGCHFLLQGIFPGQELNLHHLDCKRILYHCTTREAHGKDFLNE